MNTSFWNDCWIGDSMLKHLFPHLFALETIKDISVADKFRVHITCSFRHPVRGGLEAQQLDHLMGLIESTLLSNSDDRWDWDLNRDGVFRVKDVRNLLDETFLPKADRPTLRRNILIDSLSCPIYDGEPEDSSHLFFRCCLARDVTSYSSFRQYIVSKLALDNSGVIFLSYRLPSGDQVHDINDDEELRHEVDNNKEDDIEDDEDNESKFGYNPNIDGDDEEEEEDVAKGTSNLASNGANSSGSSFWNVETSSTSTTSIVDNIRKLEKLIINGKFTLIDDDGKPLKKVDYLGDHDSENEVESVDNDMTRSMALERVRFGAKSLLEQWSDL
ncbi:hypothetical protein Tco_0635189 [Tanacetum coccineum]